MRRFSYSPENEFKLTGLKKMHDTVRVIMNEDKTSRSKKRSF